MSQDYVELRAHSWYSFHAGASSVSELLTKAAELEQPALGLTDTGNLCGALEFARLANSLGIQPVTGADLVVQEGERSGPVTLLAESGHGYAALCRLLSQAHRDGRRRTPRLPAEQLAELVDGNGLIQLTGAPGSLLADRIETGHWREARQIVEQAIAWLGRGSVFLELQQHLVHGDRERNRRLRELADYCGVACVATNEVWYHNRSRARLHDVLVAIGLNSSLSEARAHLKANSQYWLKRGAELAQPFQTHPEAMVNSVHIAERCAGFNLEHYMTNRYRFPDAPTPQGHDAQSWLEAMCLEAARYRYGRVTRRVRDRLAEEFRRIRQHRLAGFFLIYHRVIELAREVMRELGHADREIPVPWLAPGRGRGSSVVMVVGYLIGLSHVDPLAYNLPLERFMPEDMAGPPDIDLDFPRDIREKLILRLIEEWGWEHAALTGMFATYKTRGVIRDLGRTLGLPSEEIGRLAKIAESRVRGLADELATLPGYRDKLEQPGWRELAILSGQLGGFPKGVAQHPGGMVISSIPLTDMVPVQPSAIEGRVVCQWDKDSVDDAGFVKIDLLSLGALSQMQEAVTLVRERTGTDLDLSRIDIADPAVYGDLGAGKTVGVFQVESAAQMQTITRLRPENIYDLAMEVAAVRPGVGANSGVAEFLHRRGGASWDYDHPLEEEALGRTLGIILFQDQVVHLGMDVAGLPAREADLLRRAFARRNNEDLIAHYWDVFRAGAATRGVPEETAARIFAKFNPHYMFPEGHALAFAFTAYQMAWLRHYWPLEFFIALFNQQPMGFWDPETLKVEAQHMGLEVHHPDVNRSGLKTVPDGPRAMRLGLTQVKGLDARLAATLLTARADAPFANLADLVFRSRLRQAALENLVRAGAVDNLPGVTNRRQSLWEIGVRHRPERSGHPELDLPVDGVMADLAPEDAADRMLSEYATLGLSPAGHVMELARPQLTADVLRSNQLDGIAHGTIVRVAGRVVRRQRPLAKAVFMTLEDEWGLIPVAVWPDVWQAYKQELKQPLVVIQGEVSRIDNTMNIATHCAWGLKLPGRRFENVTRPDWQ